MTNNSSLAACIKPLTRPVKVGLTCANLVILIAAIVGNVVVIYLVKRRARLRISFNYFILSMAFADLLHAIFAVPLDLSYIYQGNRWISGPFGVFLCKFAPYGIVSSIVASITTLTATTIERFLAAKLVLKKPITSKMAQIIIASIWIYSLLVSMHELIKFNVVVSKTTRTPRCIPKLNNLVEVYRVDILLKFFLTYVLPLVTMATLYANIIWMLRVHSGSSLQTQQYESILRRKRHLTMKLILITVLFAVCWLPPHVCHFIAVFNHQLYRCIPSHWVYLAFWAGHANTAINPVLYLLLTKHARALFKSTVHVGKAPDGNDDGSRRSASRKLWMFQNFTTDSRILTACVSGQTSEDEEKGHEMNLIQNA